MRIRKLVSKGQNLLIEIPVHRKIPCFITIQWSLDSIIAMPCINLEKRQTIKKQYANVMPSVIART